MKVEKIQIGSKKVMPFTIPSGIVTTEVSTIREFANGIPELGIITTKSIGPTPRLGNREPILAQYMPYGFINAVGLTNPGAEEFAIRLSGIKFQENKFLLASVFGKDADEFVYVTRTLEDCVDGFELNLSCPHAKGYGMQLGQDPNIVYEITKAIVKETKKPVFAKLTPNASNIGEIAKAAVSGGAYGITAINTVGPGYHSFEGHDVLTNKIGGLSGIGIKPIGLKCVREIRQAIGEAVPIIGMGGISDASDVKDYNNVGANIFGIGSALAGMDDDTIRRYFALITDDLKYGRNNAKELLQKVNMNYKKVEILRTLGSAPDLKVIQTSATIDAKPGQFVFAWVPGIGEKPFSVMNNDPLTLGVLTVGPFTEKINSLKVGDNFYVRGPYGKSPWVDDGVDVVLVGGGCGIAGLYLFAKFAEPNNVRTFLAAKDKEHIPYLTEFERFGEVRIATEDGSLGKKGLVTSLFEETNIGPGSYFFNCGPRRMVEAVLPLELKLTSPERIYSSVDYMTRCGVGICGSCADGKGRRTCIEGPFMFA